MSPIEIIELKTDDLNLELFSSFNRYQDVTRCWRKSQGSWILKDIAFTENWGIAEYIYLVECLRNTIKTGGTVFGAFESGVLIGFASLENEFFGSTWKYLQLSSLHVSHEKRNRGIGRSLFAQSIEKARKMGADKLYISAHSSEETQKFYHSLGCVEALEQSEKLTAEEPCDCQMEYSL
jgi:N-acetylglutamate synthase-like GNAT family acetyltransferase